MPHTGGRGVSEYPFWGTTARPLPGGAGARWGGAGPGPTPLSRSGATYCPHSDARNGHSRLLPWGKGGAAGWAGGGLGTPPAPSCRQRRGAAGSATSRRGRLGRPRLPARRAQQPLWRPVSVRALWRLRGGGGAAALTPRTGAAASVLVRVCDADWQRGRGGDGWGWWSDSCPPPPRLPFSPPPLAEETALPRTA